MNDIIKKYDRPGPRYTSYPAVPAWKGMPSHQEWLKSIAQLIHEKQSLSLYFHLPFCESLCTFCGCNVKITKNRALAKKLIHAIQSEFKLYLENFDLKNILAEEIHLGGGTPTWLTPQELETLFSPFFDQWLKFSKNFVRSIEVDPRVTSSEHLGWLKARGFNRISLGVQDFHPQVMKAVNRAQSFKLVRSFVSALRTHGFEHINFDLIYGLPFQTPESMRETFQHILELQPTRIAFYSYAHVPWIRPAQKILEPLNVPQGDTKRILYEIGRERLESSGYKEIGMDHFALRSDELFHAQSQGKLHRNFMGYTVRRSKLLLGLGPSSISDSWTAFAQNEKDFESYCERIQKNGTAHSHGHSLSHEDLKRRQVILDLMCHFKTLWNGPIDDLLPLEKDGLIQLESGSVVVTSLGRKFIRNICMVFDEHLTRTLKDKPTLYSRTV